MGNESSRMVHDTDSDPVMDTNCALGGRFGDTFIYRCRVQSIWVGQGFWRSVGTTLTGTHSVSKASSHWWVEIETSRNGEGQFWIAQFDSNSNVTLKMCKSHEHVDRVGKLAGRVKPDKRKNIRTKYDWHPTNATLTDVYEWSRKYVEKHGSYDVGLNNAQEFCNKFYKFLMIG
eukprot:Phypoly_transcript_17221.p1 GENE.Phypoly_transcript_17221~~Phypoly_transcript_17221.p1  ORF type:complete len:174 (+),score=18.53 Phypoly_transcript_17221:127-648(+)